jgi:phosphohistidine swiveling domain-containing protein
MIDRLTVPITRLADGTMVTVDGDRGEIEYDGTLTDS